jgi:hypothetical protein
MKTIFGQLRNTHARYREGNVSKSHGNQTAQNDRIQTSAFIKKNSNFYNPVAC